MIPLAAAIAYCTLVWDPSPTPDVNSYNLYWGTNHGAYSNRVHVGNVTNTTIEVPQGVTNYIVATAQIPSGLESDFSNEVTFYDPKPKPTNRVYTMNVAISNAPAPLGPWARFTNYTFSVTNQGTNLFFGGALRITSTNL